MGWDNFSKYNPDVAQQAGMPTASTFLPQLNNMSNPVDYSTDMNTSAFGSYLNQNQELTGSVFGGTSTGIPGAGTELSGWQKFGNWWNGEKGKDGTRTGGFGKDAYSLANAGMKAYLGVKQLGVMKDSLKFQKDSFNKQYNAQRDTYNTNIQDRQERRYEAAGGEGHGIVAPDDYMKLHKL